MNLIKIIVISILFFNSFNILAMTGNEWLDLQSSGNRDMAVRYIQGLSDMQTYIYHIEKKIADKEDRSVKSLNYLRPPIGSTYGQYFEIIKNFLSENPEYSHFQMPDLMFLSLGEAWRCKEH